MELRHLRYFVAVAEEQNVTRAAAKLHVSQPPLSRQIRDLEDELGFALFEHGAKSVKLTDAGRVFLGKARDILVQTKEAVEAAKAVANGQSGELRLGYSPSLTVEILPDALRVFQAENPAVRVQLFDMTTQEMLRSLRSGHLDLAILVRVSANVMEGLAFDEVRRYPAVVAMHPGHPLARSRRVKLEQIAAEPLIAFTLADYPEHHAWMTELFAPLKRPPRIREEHDSVASLIAAVEAHRGIAIVLAPFKCYVPRITIRAITPPPPALSIGIAHAIERHSPLISRFTTAAKHE